MATDIFFNDLHKIILEKLNTAEKKVKIAVAWINFKLFYSTFLKLLGQGVKLDIIVNSDFINKKHQKQIDSLIKLGAEIKLLEMPVSKKYMHEKFCIIDKKIALIGSYNWSLNARLNFENLIILDDRNVIKKLNDEFKYLKNINKEEIAKLYNLKKCRVPNCDSRLVNLLILSDGTQDKYHTREAVVVRVCSEDPDEFRIMQKLYIDGQFDFDIMSLVNEYENLLENYSDLEDNISTEQVEIYFENQFRILFSSIAHQTTHDIHGVGIIQREMQYGDEEEIYTKVLWKEKFVAQYISDEYYKTFDLL